jgi:hypothetical protein
MLGIGEARAVLEFGDCRCRVSKRVGGLQRSLPARFRSKAPIQCFVPFRAQRGELTLQLRAATADELRETVVRLKAERQPPRAGCEV